MSQEDEIASKICNAALADVGSDGPSWDEHPAQESSNQTLELNHNNISHGDTNHDRLFDGGTVCMLPIELLHQTFLYSDVNSLLVLSSVSQISRSVAERILYRHIGGPRSPTKTIQCLRTLVARPSLASHVRSYEIGNIEDHSDPLPAFFKLMSRALHGMTRLTELTILIDGPYSEILHGCPFRLTKLTSSLHWDNMFTKWTEEQPELRIALFCGRFVVGTAIDPGALPNLTRVSASPLLLAAVVPGRPIKEVEICLVHPWLLNAGLMTTTMKIMKFSTGPLNSLQIISHLSDSTEDVLAALGVIPQIVSNLDSLSFHAVSGAITVDMLGGFFNIISQFSFLRSVVLLSKDNADALHSEAFTDGLAEKWHEGCNTLESVSLPEATWVRNRIYGWLTLKDLERRLVEKAQALLDQETDIQEREHSLGEKHRALEEKERRIEDQLRRMNEDVVG